MLVLLLVVVTKLMAKRVVRPRERRRRRMASARTVSLLRYDEVDFMLIKHLASNGDDVEAPAAKKATGRKGKKSPVAETTNEDAEEQASEEPAVKPEPEDDMGELS